MHGHTYYAVAETAPTTYTRDGRRYLTGARHCTGRVLVYQLTGSCDDPIVGTWDARRTREHGPVYARQTVWEEGVVWSPSSDQEVGHGTRERTVNEHGAISPWGPLVLTEDHIPVVPVSDERAWISTWDRATALVADLREELYATARRLDIASYDAVMVKHKAGALASIVARVLDPEHDDGFAATYYDWLAGNDCTATRSTTPEEFFSGKRQTSDSRRALDAALTAAIRPLFAEARRRAWHIETHGVAWVRAHAA